jgi:broad specificity phosphatase PhoE
MTHLYHVRHGLSEMNKAGKISGHTDTPLAEEGRKQAKKTGKKAKQLGIDYIICSPLIRAHETAKIIAREIGYPIDKIEVNPLFIERNFGAMEGQPYRPDIDYDGIADAEKTDVFLARAEQAVMYLKSLPHSKILVVSHGSTSRALRHHLIKDQPFHMPIKYKNAELVEWIIT